MDAHRSLTEVRPVSINTSVAAGMVFVALTFIGNLFLTEYPRWVNVVSSLVAGLVFAVLFWFLMNTWAKLRARRSR